MTTRCGYVAILGAPNAGKSTLLNAMVGAKIAIVTPKVQTTRARIIAIALEEMSQIIFIDTPGIFAPKRRLDKAMVAAAWSGAADGDILLFILDAHRGLDDDSRRILAGLKDRKKPVLLVLNKVDLVRKDRLLALANEVNKIAPFAETYMISAETGDGVADLRSYLARTMPQAPWFYPEDQIADLPERQLAAEITREKLFLRLWQELPYALTVETEDWRDQEDGSARIEQTIYVTRDSHKPIILGKGGLAIKAIGQEACADMETVFERRVHLFLFVKVREGWQDDPERYRAMGLDFPGT